MGSRKQPGQGLQALRARAPEGTYVSKSLDARTVVPGQDNVALFRPRRRRGDRYPHRQHGETRQHMEPIGARRTPARPGSRSRPEGALPAMARDLKARDLRRQPPIFGEDADCLHAAESPTQVVGINVLPAGVALQKQPYLQTGTLSLSSTSGEAGRPELTPRAGKGQAGAAPRQALEPGAQSFTWKATDDNDDTLELFALFQGRGGNRTGRCWRRASATRSTLSAGGSARRRLHAQGPGQRQTVQSFRQVPCRRTSFEAVRHQ